MGSPTLYLVTEQDRNASSAWLCVQCKLYTNNVHPCEGYKQSNSFGRLWIPAKLSSTSALIVLAFTSKTRYPYLLCSKTRYPCAIVSGFVVRASRQALCSLGLSANQLVILFSHIKSTPATGQLAVLFSHNKSSSATAKRTQRILSRCCN